MNQLLDENITCVKGIGPKLASLFQKLKIFSVYDLVTFFPKSYEDWFSSVNLSENVINQVCCIKAKIISDIRIYKTKNNMTIFSCVAISNNQELNIVFFNNPYVCKKLKIGKQFLFYGRVTFNKIRFEMISPKFSENCCGRLLPVYKQTMGLSSHRISVCVNNALSLLKNDFKPYIPQHIIKKYGFNSYFDALYNVHFPISHEILLNAKKLLAFSELFILKLSFNLIKTKKELKNSTLIKKDYSEEFFKLLPFSPTASQKRAILDCYLDMSKNSYPMSRLLQGDVGSGKTAVAAAACYNIAKNHLQAAFMAPTEILATQHYSWLKKIFANTSLNVVLLTGSTPSSKKREIKQNLKLGLIDIIIGTHALLTDEVQFKNLALAIVDEQHRFGVLQRLALFNKGSSPHTLIMSATPIPRTLSFIIYGDLDVSILDELPPNRKKIDTFYIDDSKRMRMFGFLKKLINEGRQGYIVCPLIEENEGDLLSVEKYEKIIKRSELKSFNIKVIHGKMKTEEKEKIMRDFLNGNINILLCTTVIEVGLDVKNAAFMVIENAERFGLSQLHQLRGRVGRGEFKSYCIMVSNAQNKEAVNRFKIMKQMNNGFKIADEDLKIRGPGDFFGNRQHGLPKLKIANIITDTKLLFDAQKEAENILNKDPYLLNESNLNLKNEVQRLLNSVEI